MKGNDPGDLYAFGFFIHAPHRKRSHIPTRAGQKYGGYLRSRESCTRTLMDEHIVPTKIKTNQKTITKNQPRINQEPITNKMLGTKDQTRTSQGPTKDQGPRTNNQPRTKNQESTKKQEAITNQEPRTNQLTN